MPVVLWPKSIVSVSYQYRNFRYGKYEYRYRIFEYQVSSLVSLQFTYTPQNCKFHCFLVKNGHSKQKFGINAGIRSDIGISIGVTKVSGEYQYRYRVFYPTHTQSVFVSVSKKLVSKASEFNYFYLIKANRSK